MFTLPCVNCNSSNRLDIDEIVVHTITNVRTDALWTCSICDAEHRQRLNANDFLTLIGQGVQHVVTKIPAEISEIINMTGAALTTDDLIDFGLAISKIDTLAGELV